MAVLSLALRILAAATGAAGVGLLGVSAAIAYRSARPGRAFGQGEPPEGSYERVYFRSADGLGLSGWFFPAPERGPGLILCHGFQTGRREAARLAMALQEKGNNVLVFDFRAHGESEGRWTSCGVLETRDLEGAVRYMSERPETRGNPVGVVGFSMGAAVAIMTAARTPSIAAVIADSSFSSFRSVLETGFRAIWRLPSFPLAPLTLWFGERLAGICADDNRPIDVVAKLSPRPLLIAHGEADRIVPVHEARRLFEAAAEPKELWIAPGADHVQAREMDLAGYAERVDTFFARWLKETAA